MGLDPLGIRRVHHSFTSGTDGDGFCQLRFTRSCYPRNLCNTAKIIWLFLVKNYLIIPRLDKYWYTQFNGVFIVVLKYLWCKICNVSFFPFQCLMRDKHGEVSIFHSYFLDFSVKEFFDALPNSIWPGA